MAIDPLFRYPRLQVRQPIAISFPPNAEGLLFHIAFTFRTQRWIPNPLAPTAEIEHRASKPSQSDCEPRRLFRWARSSYLPKGSGHRSETDGSGYLQATSRLGV